MVKKCRGMYGKHVVNKTCSLELVALVMNLVYLTTSVVQSGWYAKILRSQCGSNTFLFVAWSENVS